MIIFLILAPFLYKVTIFRFYAILGLVTIILSKRKQNITGVLIDSIPDLFMSYKYIQQLYFARIIAYHEN